MSRLDLTAPVAFGCWLAGLRSAFANADAVELDMLRAPGDRELGPKLHARNYTAAREQVLRAIAFADGSDSEPADPAGDGGDGHAH